MPAVSAPSTVGRSAPPRPRSDGDDDSVRRSVVPPVAARSLWLAAVWTGVGAALVGAVLAIAAVAVCWLPASGAAGNSNSAIRAGVLTFLASLHGGVTVGGLDSAFVPLGMTIAAGVLAWRAGSGLADAAADLDETQPRRLVGALALQTASFATACGIAAALSGLGTSNASVPGAVIAGALLFALAGGTSFVRGTCLGVDARQIAPDWLAPSLRVAAAVAATYLGAGALLVAGSLVVHHDAVQQLSAQVGGGWSGAPVLLLGLLAAPNAAIAGAAYLAGPGFAVGSGTTVALGSSPRGTLPSFPVLGGLPSGPANWSVWSLAVLTPIAAGACAATLAHRAPGWRKRWRDAGLGVAMAGLAGLVLAWQGGGGIGSGRLHALGASPWQFGLVVASGTGVATAALLGLRFAFTALRSRQDDGQEFGPLTGLLSTVTETVSAAATAAAEAVHTDRDSDTAGSDRDVARSAGNVAGSDTANDAASDTGAPGQDADAAGNAGRDGKLAG